jgi:hypothetical protein
MPAKFQVKPGERLMISLHVGDSFPNSEGPMDPARIRDARLSDGSPFGDFSIIGNATHGFTRPSAMGSLYASLASEPRFIELAPAKFESYLKEEGLDAVIAARKERGESAKPGRELYSKYAKTLLVSGSSSADYAKPAGLTIEFVPEADPSAVKPGGKLPVKVLWRGQPAAGLFIQAAHSSGSITGVGRTDAQGRIAILLPRAGQWRLHTVAMERCQDPQRADWESFWASLTFEIR